MAKIVAFEISATFGHFRVPGANTYLQTLPFPPRPAICGMIGAIMGWSEDEVMTKQKEVLVGVRIRHLSKRITDYMILRPYGKKNNEIKPVRMELLLNPSYVIYAGFNRDNEELGVLQKRLNEMNFEFPICMGKNEFMVEDFKVLSEQPIDARQTVCKSPKSVIFFKDHIPKLSFSQLDDLRRGATPLPFLLPNLPFSLSKMGPCRKISELCNAYVLSDEHLQYNPTIQNSELVKNIYLLNNGDEVCLV